MTTPDPTFTVTATNGRIRVECEQCGESMDSPDNRFGQAMASEFAKKHKCWKPRKARTKAKP